MMTAPRARIMKRALNLKYGKGCHCLAEIKPVYLYEADLMRRHVTAPQ